jgi:hypothetical protein
VRRISHSLIRRIGRRGAALLFFALLDLLYGLSLASPDPQVRLSPSVAFIAHVAPLPAWAALWAAVGVACLAGAFVRHDRWAFTAAVALKVLWGVTFLVGWLVAHLERGWVPAVIWLAMAGWVLIIASWPEPPPDEGLLRLEKRR